MSGGYFGFYEIDSELKNCWQDEEINELINDLFFGSEFSVRGYGGLFQSLDFHLSCDIGEDSYKKKVQAFKNKWFRRTPKNRIEFYQGKIQEYADKCKEELGFSEEEPTKDLKAHIIYCPENLITGDLYKCSNCNSTVELLDKECPNCHAELENRIGI